MAKLWLFSAILLAQFTYGKDNIFGTYESYYRQHGYSAISNDYEQITVALTMALESQLSKTALEARNTLHDAGYVRASQALPCLLVNMGYDRDVRNNYTNDNTLFELGPPKYVANTLLWHPHSRYPVVGAILSIGVKFDVFAKEMALYPPSKGRDLSFADIGRASAGLYFNEFVEKHANIGEESRNRIVSALNSSPIKQLEKHASNFDIQRKYDAMKEVLLSSFNAELGINSKNIANIILTMGFIRSLEAVPLLAENLTICPQTSTNVPGAYTFPAAEALIEIGPAIGYCFDKLDKAEPLSLEESLWLRISHELYPEGLEYDLMRRAETNDTRAARLLSSLPWRRLDSNYELIDRPTEIKNEVDK